MTEILRQIKAVFRQRFGQPPAHIARAPGRVNLLGEHVDYNDGFVLPVGIDRATYVAFCPSESDMSEIIATDFRAETTTFTPDSVRTRTSIDGEPLSDWARYPAGMAWALNGAGLRVKGMNAVFASNVPRGAGLSSSASVEMAFGVAWMALGGWTIEPMQLALIGQRAENNYVGVHCGIMDQFASACSEKDRLLLLDCRSLKYQALPLPKEVEIVVADTSVRHTLTTSAYNERRAACEEAVRIFKLLLPGITALRDVSPDDFNRLAERLSPAVQKRARHIVEEIERTTRAVELLKTGDIAGFGRLMNACHTSLRDLYEVSCPELDVMARIAQSLQGCYGGRLTGAGFGGCTVNLVKRSSAGAFARDLAASYEARTGRHPEIYLCEASPGAGLI